MRSIRFGIDRMIGVVTGIHGIASVLWGNYDQKPVRALSLTTPDATSIPMSQYHFGRVASVLDQTFTALIDMSDWTGRSENAVQVAFRSRALRSARYPG